MVCRRRTRFGGVVTTSLLGDGEVRKALGTLGLAIETMSGSTLWLEMERQDGCVQEAGRPAGFGETGRSQSLGSTGTANWG